MHGYGRPSSCWKCRNGFCGFCEVAFAVVMLWLAFLASCGDQACGRRLATLAEGASVAAPSFECPQGSGKVVSYSPSPRRSAAAPAALHCTCTLCTAFALHCTRSFLHVTLGEGNATAGTGHGLG